MASGTPRLYYSLLAVTCHHSAIRGSLLHVRVALVPVKIRLNIAFFHFSLLWDADF